jgi:hypothetical protein
MNGAVQDLLREGLDRLTAEVEVPAGLAGKARTHLRRRKTAVRAALAGGTAVITAGVTVAAVGAGRGSPPVIRARTASYVLSRVENALAAPGQVVQTETVFSAGMPPVMAWNYRGNMRLTQSGYIPPALVKGMPWAQGRVDWGAGTTRRHGRLAYVQVDYRHHEWYESPAMDFTPGGCTRPDIVEFNSPLNWASYLRQALSCGLMRVAGHAQAGGKETLKLTGSAADRDFWSKLPHGEGRGPLRVDVTLYVDPATFFPVLVTWDNRTHWRDGKPLDGTVRQDIRLLPPTPDNTALADVTVPAGFRQVPGSTFGGPVWPYFTSG